MREDKRFRILERKGLEYIFDTENTPAFWDEDVDFIELLGDSLSEQEIVDLLNKQDEEIKELKDRIDKYRDDNESYSFNTGKIKPENPRFKVTDCSTEILDTTNNHYHWLEMEGNVEEICRILNELNCENKKLREDNDIKFWKQKWMCQNEIQVLLLRELRLAINKGYGTSKDFKQIYGRLKKKNKECNETEKKLFNNELIKS